MSLNDSITELANETLTVTRTAVGSFVAGIYVTGAATTFSIEAVVQPAFNLNRVIGGSDLQAGLDNQRVETIYQVHTATELLGRDTTKDPDVVTYKGAPFTVARAEEWNLDGEVHYHCVITKQTQGAS